MGELLRLVQCRIIRLIPVYLHGQSRHPICWTCLLLDCHNVVNFAMIHPTNLWFRQLIFGSILTACPSRLLPAIFTLSAHVTQSFVLLLLRA